MIAKNSNEPTIPPPILKKTVVNIPTYAFISPNNKAASVSGRPTAVLAISITSKKPLDNTKGKNKKVLVASAKNPEVPIGSILLIVGSLLLIACAILFFWKRRKTAEE
jgi:hypothetical protein